MTEAIRLREQVLEPLKGTDRPARILYGHPGARGCHCAAAPPLSECFLSDGNIILWEDIHLGIATSVDENLIVPVIREAQNRTWGRLSPHWPT
jgi:pyruvate/2-oxoglutarate dehydrogenase complex dihydrolipoamide acyltransferase (E2) component